jgi:hypothetical protein
MTDSVPAGPSSSRISEFVICRPPLRTNMADSGVAATGYRKGFTCKSIGTQSASISR